MHRFTGVSRLSLLFFSLLISLQCSAQLQGQGRLDSLLGRAAAIDEDSNGVQVLLDISFLYRTIDPEEGIKYGNRGLSLARKIKWRMGEAKSYNSLGNNYKAQSDYKNALKYFQASLGVFEELTGRERQAAIVKMNIGTVYRPLKEYDKALKYFNEALETILQLGDDLTAAQLYGNIGVVYFEQKHYAQALEYNTKALQIFEREGDGDNTAWVLSNIGDAYESSEQFDKALDYQQRALQITKELNSRGYQATALNNIGRIYYKLALIQNNTAARNNYLQKGVEHYESALPIEQELGDVDYMEDVHSGLADIYTAMGKFALAEQHLEIAEALDDSVRSAKVREGIVQLETQRAIELKDREVEIARLKKRTDRIYLFAGIGIALLVVVSVLIAYVRQRRSNKVIYAEKKRSDELLLNILPEEVAEELKGKGTASAKSFNNVTVLFTDFVNFTVLAEKLSPQALVDELHACFKAFDDITSRHRIEKIKTVGDAYLAVSGLPVADRDHAKNVVSAAMEITSFIANRRQQLGEHTFEIRVGVHSGSVVAGIVGVKKFAYDIWGDTVNTAARMEQASEAGRINISQATYELVKDDFVCTPRGAQEVKNKGRMEMYFVS